MNKPRIADGLIGSIALGALAFGSAAEALVVVNPPPGSSQLTGGTLTADCTGYSARADAANLAAGTAYTADYNLTLSCSSAPSLVVETGRTAIASTGSNGTGSGSYSGQWGTRLNGTCGVSGTATLTQNQTSTTYYVNTPTFACTAAPGVTFSIGPSSMEGNLTIMPGDWVAGGYSFSFKNATHAATSLSITASVAVPVNCPKGGGSGGTITVNLGTRTFAVPAGATAWLPTGDQNSSSSWMGANQAPDLCNGHPMNNQHGAIYTATISQSPASGSDIDFRFKYRDPNAKGKGNVNCLDTSNPLRAKADVCGASWSQTVTEP